MIPASATIGMIVPPAAGQVPPDGAQLYGDRPLRFIARGLALQSISPEGFDDVADRIVSEALALREAGAQAVSLMGTSLSFYRGAAFTESLRERMQQATGVPCTTMSPAIVASMRALGLRRVAVATAYIETLNARLVAYLASQDIEVTAIRGLDMTGVEAVGEVPEAALTALAEQVLADGGGAQGLLFSCGGLHTLGLHAPLEARLGIPVTSSSPAGFWDVMRAAGLDASAPGFGKLFAHSSSRAV
jgi:arylmalonate decarboxylase